MSRRRRPTSPATASSAATADRASSAAPAPTDAAGGCPARARPASRGRCRNWARVQVCTVRPARMMLTPSQSASASARMWLESRTAWPSARRRAAAPCPSRRAADRLLRSPAWRPDRPPQRAAAASDAALFGAGSPGRCSQLSPVRTPSADATAPCTARSNAWSRTCPQRRSTFHHVDGHGRRGEADPGQPLTDLVQHVVHRRGPAGPCGAQHRAAGLAPSVTRLLAGPLPGPP